jgi:hypothetical protein
MKENLPYEKLIAEKMKGLPVPDKEASWQHMKTLLDNEMPVSLSGKRGPGGKWWWMSSFAIIIIIGTTLFFYTTTKEVIPKQLSQTNKESKAKPDSPFYHSNSVIDHTSTSPSKKEVKSSGSEESVQIAEHKRKVDEVKPNMVLKGDDTREKDITKNNAIQSLSNSKSTQPGIKDEKPIVENNSVAKNNISSIQPAEQLSNIPGARYKKNKPEKFTRIQQTQHNSITSSSINRTISNKNGNAVLSKIKDIKITAYKNIIARNEDELLASFEAEHANDDDLFKDLSLQKVKTFDERSLIVYEDENNPGINIPANVWALPDVKTQQKKILKEIKRKERKEERELAKSYRPNQSFWGAKTDRWFAAGIAPFQNFAIASQQSYNYNSAGGKGVASDYIPSPYLQLHVTSRIYLMSEFQFNAPQATPDLLLSQKSINAPRYVAGCSENVYLRKLYYFNLPISFYYSPVKNFYVGSGIQFSSLNSGLAYIEQRSQNNTLIHSETVKIKDDQFSTRIKGSEWRYLFDANYYANRFMFGFRYNQALNNYISLRPNNNLPVTQARNQSFQFYIRYNIIVSNKKR